MVCSPLRGCLGGRARAPAEEIKRPVPAPGPEDADEGRTADRDGQTELALEDKTAGGLVEEQPQDSNPAAVPASEPTGAQAQAQAQEPAKGEQEHPDPDEEPGSHGDAAGEAAAEADDDVPELLDVEDADDVERDEISPLAAEMRSSLGHRKSVREMQALFSGGTSSSNLKGTGAEDAALPLSHKSSSSLSSSVTKAERLDDMNATVQSRSKTTTHSVKFYEDKIWIEANVASVKHF